MNNIVKDIEKLTTIPNTSLSNLVELCTFCIVNEMQESMLGNENITKVDIGFGTLLILVENNVVKYKFIPSDDLTKAVNTLVSTKTNPLTVKIENKLVSSITNTYKELI